MAESNFRGPITNMGAMEDTSISPFDGPNLSYQGYALPDPRFVPFPKDGTAAARVPSFLISGLLVVTDNIPSTLSSSQVVTTAQSAVAAQAFSLNTTSAGGSAAGVPSWSAGIPIIPLGTTIATAVAAIDFGFTTGTTAANSSTVVVVDSSLFDQGEWIVIGGAGNVGLTTSLITQVITVTNATTIKIAPVALGALSHAPIGNSNLQQSGGLIPPATNFGPSN